MNDLPMRPSIGPLAVFGALIASEPDPQIRFRPATMAIFSLRRS